jgi:hypothetical protein
MIQLGQRRPADKINWNNYKEIHDRIIIVNSKMIVCGIHKLFVQLICHSAPAIAKVTEVIYRIECSIFHTPAIAKVV